MTTELRSRGCYEIESCDASESCLAALAANPLALLVIDSDHDERTIVKVLAAAQGPYRLDTRRIYFIPYSPDETVLAYALEYNILQLHAGDLSQNQINRNFTDFVRYGQRTSLQLRVFERVVQARKLGDLSMAHDLLHSLCGSEPENIQAHAELGFALCELGRWEDAQASLVETVARFPFDSRSKHLLSRCFMKRGNFEKARYYLEQAQLLSPFNVERLVELGQIMLSQYQVEAALGSFQSALATDGDLQEAQLGVARCELLMGESNDALKIMHQLRGPNEFASVFNGAAIVAVRAGHFHQGIGLYKTAAGYLVEHPDLMSRIFFNMGLGLWKWGKSQLAQAAFERAVELDGSNRKAQHNADRIAWTLRRGVADSDGLDAEEGPFGSLNRIDTIDDFSEIDDDSYSSFVSRS